MTENCERLQGVLPKPKDRFCRATTSRDWRTPSFNLAAQPASFKTLSSTSSQCSDHITPITPTLTKESHLKGFTSRISLLFSQPDLPVGPRENKHLSGK